MLRLFSILIPDKEPHIFSSIIALLSPYATSRNKRGEIGQPCLRPLSEVNKGEEDPLIRTAKYAVEI